VRAIVTWSLLVAVCSAGESAAESHVSPADARSLLVAAIEAPDGKALGVLTGDEAGAITRRFNGTTPIHVEVTTLRRYAQPGCSRLNVRVWQDGVRLPYAKAAQRQTIDVGINYCRNGQPPKSLD
jgi:hypothetical protein